MSDPSRPIAKAAAQGVMLEYATCCQHDIVPGRHPDRGSSCCALFASAVACGVLAARAELQMPRLTALLRRCVIAYDDMGPQACAGSYVADMARDAFAESGVSIRPRELVVNRAGLQTLGDEALRGPLPAGILLTAIPATTSTMNATGNTFAVFFTEDAIHLVDSHRHQTPTGPRGFVWARCSSWCEMLDWVFCPEGLLDQLDSRADFLEAVTLLLDVAQPPARGSDDAEAASPSPVRPDAAKAGSPFSAATPCAGAESAAHPVAAVLARRDFGEDDDGAECVTCRRHAVFQMHCDKCRWAKCRLKWQVLLCTRKLKIARPLESGAPRVGEDAA